MKKQTILLITSLMLGIGFTAHAMESNEKKLKLDLSDLSSESFQDIEQERDPACDLLFNNQNERQDEPQGLFEQPPAFPFPLEAPVQLQPAVVPVPRPKQNPVDRVFVGLNKILDHYEKKGAQLPASFESALSNANSRVQTIKATFERKQEAQRQRIREGAQRKAQEELILARQERYNQWAASQSDEQVTLQSQDGQDFKILVRHAELSETLKHLIEDAGVEDALPLPTIKGRTLAILIGCLNLLEKVQVGFEKNVYIPRFFQRGFNRILEEKNVTFIEKVELLLAVNYLDIPYILNATASAIVDSVDKDLLLALLRSHEVPYSKKDENEKEAAIARLKESGLGVLVDIPAGPWEYVAKHIRFRLNGILQEYSIADYIAQHGQPKLVTCFFGYDQYKPGLDLQHKKLTSLFGLELLACKDQMEILLLDHNCFYDFALDSQKVESPFVVFSKLEKLSMNTCDLVRLQPKLFAGLASLLKLEIKNNNLNTLPVEVFVGLDNVHTLDLWNNDLSSIPKRSFIGLPNLQQLHLEKNRIDCLEDGLFGQMPFLRNLYLQSNMLTQLGSDCFDGLSNLEQLDISDNTLSVLDKNVFVLLTHLTRLDLPHNDLVSLPEAIFDTLVNLQYLDLSHNKLKNVPKNIFANLLALQYLYLFKNNLTSFSCDQFRNLVHLNKIDLRMNKLASLSDLSADCFPNLQELKLGRNPKFTLQTRFKIRNTLPDRIQMRGWGKTSLKKKLDAQAQNEEDNSDEEEDDE